MSEQVRHLLRACPAGTTSLDRLIPAPSIVTRVSPPEGRAVNCSLGPVTIHGIRRANPTLLSTH